MREEQKCPVWTHNGKRVWNISDLAQAFGTQRRNLLSIVEHREATFGKADTYLILKGETVLAARRDGTEGEMILNCNRRVFTRSGVAKLQKCYGAFGKRSDVTEGENQPEAAQPIVTVRDLDGIDAALLTVLDELRSLCIWRGCITEPETRAEADRQICAFARSICALIEAPKRETRDVL